LEVFTQKIFYERHGCYPRESATAVRRRKFFRIYGIPTGQLPDDSEDVGSKYYNYSSRVWTTVKNQCILELYGAINWYTTYRYMWVDTIIKQTIMLADKSGLRRKPLKVEENKDGKRKEYTPEQKQALVTNLFAAVAKKIETDDERAERIRNEINKK